MPKPPKAACQKKPGCNASNPITGDRPGTKDRSPAHLRAIRFTARVVALFNALDRDGYVELLGLGIDRDGRSLIRGR